MDAQSEARRLVLMRHAKSDWSTPGQSDHARPLNRRGRLAAPLMGAWLAEQPWAVDLALVSDAARTEETWTRLAPLLPQAPPKRSDPGLYHAEPEAMLTALRGAGDARTVLMIGHNPGLESFVTALIAKAGGPLRFATAAIAVLRLAAGGWATARFGDFELESFEEPKSLV